MNISLVAATAVVVGVASFTAGRTVERSNHLVMVRVGSATCQKQGNA